MTEETIYCEVCGEKPYYISIHDESRSPKEYLLCKDCYAEYED